VRLARCVEPEWLDVLDPEDPRASRSREDLQRVNRVMRNAAILMRAVQKANCRPQLIVELGAGDGTFLLRVLQQQTLGWQGGKIIFVDRQSIVTKHTREAFSLLGWDVDTAEADVLTWLPHDSPDSIDLMIANLFLHHFHNPQLVGLLSSAATRTSLFVACEPRRSYSALAGSRLLGLIGCNDVSRHDATISVRAGFADHELSSLWPPSSPYRLEEYEAGLFSHCFVAQRT
jgi:hypothetical protein